MAHMARLPLGQPKITQVTEKKPKLQWLRHSHIQIFASESLQYHKLVLHLAVGWTHVFSSDVPSENVGIWARCLSPWRLLA